MDYTKLSHESILDEWNNRILADEKYKNLSQASIYAYFQEMFSGVMDMTNYYIQRTAEENYLDTAKLDSSIIKLGKNLGYQPKRAVPAVGNISIELRGPLPSTVQAGDTIWFNNEDLKFTFNGHDFMLDACYSYTLTEADVRDGQSPSWRKKILYAVNGYETQQDGYITLSGKVSATASSKLRYIKVVQGKRAVKVLDPITYSNKIGKQYQFYDIDDLSFSNWYGIRDPFAYVNGEYSKQYGITKVGIGTDQKSAFQEDSLFYIEDEAVELSKAFKKRKKSEFGADLKVCCIRSNYDKTVRIYFGNGIDSCPGLTSTDQNLYVQYFQTDGSDANYPNAVGSVLSAQGKIYASRAGSVTNISNYVTFMFESAVHGGTDFESKERIKINSKIYFASTSKLITLPDFMSYLLTITDPINVKHAIAYGENQLEDLSGEHDAGRTNIVLYTLFSDIYREANGLYRPINIFDENEDISNSCLYIDYNTYMQHLFDFVSFLIYPKGTTSDQYLDRSTFGQWAAQIRADAEPRMIMNSKLVSLPPVFHYYDVVGDIQVDRHIDMSKFKDELENSLYQWLAENTTFKSQIFKSDIYNKILENPGAKRANIDIKVSELIKGSAKTYRFEPGSVQTNKNILILPEQDIRGTTMEDIFYGMEGRDITLQVIDGSSSSSNFRIEEVSIDPDNVYLSLSGNPSVNSTYYVDITFEEDSFFTKGKITDASTNMLNLIINWVNARKTVNGTADRPIELPYTINFDPGEPEELKKLDAQVHAMLISYITLKMLGVSGTTLKSLEDSMNLGSSILKTAEEFYSNKIIREETFTRVGANSTNYLENLSEEAFYFAIRDAINSGSITYQAAKQNFQYVYPLLKQIFDDNILDDNNNIVNFTSDRDIPVLRFRFRYTYA